MGVSKAPEHNRRGLSWYWAPLDVEALSPPVSVAVMAPALTEGGPQKPNNLHTPLPSVGFLSPEKAAQVCNNRAVLAKFVVTANVQPTKIDEQCLRGISKDLIRDVINSKYENGLDCLSKHCVLDDNDGLIASDFVKDIDILRVDEDNNFDKNQVDLDVVKRPDHTDSKVSEVIDAIMSDSAAGHNDEMGFIKASDILPLVPLVGPIINDDDKDMESIMDIAPDLGTGDDAIMPQNVEDILQAIQSIEGEHMAQAISDATDAEADNAPEMFNIAQSFSSFEPDLLNDVMGLVNENMSINLGEHLSMAEAEETAEAQRENDLRTKQENVESKCFEQDRRTAFLLRRLRKLQARTIGRHIAEEATGVLELAHHSVKKYFLQELQTITGKGTPRSLPQIPEDLNAFIKSIEKSCAAQSNTVTAHCNRQKNYCRYFGAGSRDIGVASTSGNRHSPFSSAHVKLNSEQVENVAGSLATQLHTVESNLDSDCTASSSGGESCDEMLNYNNSHQQQLPM